MEIILNLFVIALLGITIGFCWRLNRKIVELKNSRKELTNFLQNFDKSISSAQNSVAEIKKATATSLVELQQNVSHARDLTQDLTFLNENANKVADKLEAQIKDSKTLLSSTSEKPKTTPTKRRTLKSKASTKKTTTESTLTKTKSALLKAIKLAKRGGK